MKRHLLLAYIVCLCLHQQQSDACTVFLAGRKATVDGSVLISHSNDGEFTTDPRLVKIPAADHPPNSTRPVYFSPEDYPRYVGTGRGNIPAYAPKSAHDATIKQEQLPFEPIGYIPQVAHTYAYMEQTYGALNEHQLGIGESTCSGVFGAIPLGHPNGTALLSVDALTQIAMERCTTARDAILTMGALAEQYGFYGAGSFEGTAESLAVSDPQEAWIFHVLPDPTGKSAIWAAQKVPDEEFAVLANMFVIRQINASDTDRFLFSQSVYDVAQDYGWWKSVEEDGLLDFTALYSDGEYAHKFYSGRRMWGAYHLMAPSLDLPSNYSNLLTEAVYPVSTPPDELIALQDFFTLHRYTYQNTPFDLSQPGNLAAGPFGSPDRWKGGANEIKVGGAWERAIGLYRTSDTHIVQTRPQQQQQQQQDGIGGVLWFAPSSPLGSVFTPFVVDMPSIPLSFEGGHQIRLDKSTMFWAAVYVHNIANLKWSYMMQDIEKKQKELEGKSIQMVQEMDAFLAEYPRTGAALYEAVQRVYETYRQNADEITQTWWELSDELMFTYADGFVNRGPTEMSQVVGYPEWWLEKVGFQEGPPPVPERPKRRKGVDVVEVMVGGSTGKVAMKEFLKESEGKEEEEGEGDEENGVGGWESVVDGRAVLGTSNKGPSPVA